MSDLFIKKTTVVYVKRRIVSVIFVIIALALFTSPAMAIDLELFGNPLAINGYVNQAVQFGNIISEGQIDFDELTEKDLSTKITISLASQGLRIENAKLFDKIVFGID